MPDAPSGAFERRIVSVLFADLVGFTTLGERLDPEDVAAIQDRYFEAVRDTAGRYDGRLEKFIGDAAVAAFGVPRARDDDAERAVRTGLAIIGAVERLGAELGLADGELAVRIGIATGEVVHAESGPDAGRLTGDTMNISARLQAAAPAGAVLVSEPTALAVAEAIELAPATSLELKGKAEAVRASVVIGVRPERSREAAMGALRAPTIGREPELVALGDALGRVLAGRTTERWLVVAPPGTGKTRLLDEFGRRATEAGALIRRARFRVDDPRPFGAVADLTAGIDRGELGARLVVRGASVARADVVVGLVRALDGETVEDAATVDRDARFDAWLEALDAAGDGPEAWLVEDAHWAGPDALAFLDAVHDRPATSGRLVVVATRPSLLDRDEAWTTARPEAGRYRLDLPGLGPGDAASLVSGLVGDVLPGELVERIAVASDGNCLFIEELLRTWVSVGLLRRLDDRWVMSAAPESVTVPASVHAVYGAQLDDLPAEARTLARRAAVAGRRFPSDALPDLGAADPSSALTSLARRALIDGPTQAPVIGPAYTYRHALLRDAAYASLARAERASLHVALARWLESAAGDRADEVSESIGRHYLAAVESASGLTSLVGGGLERPEAIATAAAWFERAGAYAASQSAHAASVELLGIAVDLTPSDDAVSLARRRGDLGRGLRSLGRMDDAVARLREAMDAARAARTAGAEAIGRQLLALASESLCDLLFEQLHFQEAWDLAEATIAEVGGDADVAFAGLLLSRGRARSGETNESEPWIADAEAALTIAIGVGDRRLELAARSELAAATGEAGRGSTASWDDVAQLAVSLGDWGMATRSIANGASFLVDERPAEVSAALAPARALAEAHGLTERLGWIEYMECEAALASGDWDRGVTVGETALDLAERYGFHRVGVRSIAAVLPMAAMRGDALMVERCQRWYEAARHRSLPASPYGRILHAGAEAWYDRFGVETHPPPDLSRLRDGFAYEPSGPSWSASLASIFATWRAAGMVDEVEVGIAIVRLALDRATPRSTLADGALEVESALAHLAAGMPADSVAASARAALELLRIVDARWWIVRAVRVLDEVGAATPVERAEAHRIATSLRLTDRAI